MKVMEEELRMGEVERGDRKRLGRGGLMERGRKEGERLKRGERSNN